MNRLKIYRACLAGALLVSILMMGFYVRWYVRTQIPDVVRVGVGDEQTLDLGLKEVSVRVVERKRVIPGGIPIGIYLETEGVYVVGTGEVEAADGLNYEPAYQIVQAGDYILAVNGRQIHDKDELIDCVQANKSEIMILKLLRNGQVIKVRVHAVETKEEDFKLGVWVKDDIQGIGTLTYLTEDMRFGALGHGITDTDTGELLEASGGSGNGIGLKNVQDRIKINFGDRYGIEIASKLGCYTKIMIRIPMAEKNVNPQMGGEM